MQSPCFKAAERVCLYGCCTSPLLVTSEDHEPQKTSSKSKSTLASSRQGFAAITASTFFPNTHFTNHENLPSLQESLVQFTKAYPRYSETSQVDQIRAEEYYHLSLSKHICLDYIGIGLFSYLQIQSLSSSAVPVASSSSPPPRISDASFFNLSYKSVNLKSQLLHGGQGSHPFQHSRNLLTVYDYESEALQTMVNTSERRGAKIMSAEFKWPRLRVHSTKLRKMIGRKNKKKKNQGLFVIPLQSRMTGASYSYQWMSIAQENGWHVLLDGCALGPKDMGSFGLSLFRPDFLVCSFYKVIGENPTGFGCLCVKRSTVQILEASTGTGIVSLVPANQLSQEDSSGTDTELEQISIPEAKEEMDREIFPSGLIVSQGRQTKRPTESETATTQEMDTTSKAERLGDSETMKSKGAIVSYNNSDVKLPDQLAG